ncbi:MAG: hemerythrin domain-containing protein [Herminiimonas sp.]|nr:hemerythrin domain-containing protein [Herminiimonas sp.]
MMDTFLNELSVLWTADMAVGCQRLDQHNERMFRELAAADAMAASMGPAALAAWLSAVFDRFDWLLQEEEKELAGAGYPELAFHRTLHARARARIQAARAQLAKSPDAESLAVLAHNSCVELSVWLMRHIQDADKLFFPYVDKRYRSGSA